MEEDEILTACALKFDGWRYCESAILQLQLNIATNFKTANG